MRTLVTAVENLVLFGTIGAVCTFALAGAVRWASRRERWRPKPSFLARAYAGAVALPPLAGLWLVAAALLPERWLGTAEFTREHAQPEHLHHLLSDLTASLEPGIGVATAALAVAGLFYAAGAAARGYRHVGRVIGRLDVGAAAPPAEKVALVERAARAHGLEVGLVLGKAPYSFVWGFTRSRLVLSSGLLEALSPAELLGVLEHETAHHTRRDNLVKLALSFCAHATLMFPLARRVLAWRAEAVELVCDEVAAARTREPLEIAAALLKVRRMAAEQALGLRCVHAAEFLPAGPGGFEYRVRRLLEFADRLPPAAAADALSRGPGGAVTSVALAFLATLVGVLALAPLAVHRGVEALIMLLT
jgi:Zn-dependent protease with chaperone function